LLSRKPADEAKDQSYGESSMDNASSNVIQDYQLTIDPGEQMHMEQQAPMEEKQDAGGGIDADLEISDSEDEQVDDQDNNEGLYF
jgi:hypothetical protein